MSRFKRFILLFFMVALGISLYAQVTVTGKVTDADGYEVIGGSVVLKGSPTIGTVTDMTGSYSLTIDDASNAVLVFSYVGMQTQEVKVNGRNVINVQLNADAVLLDEVVAIGYATVKRKDLTGSVSSSNTTWTFNMNTFFGRISITRTGVNIYVSSTAIGNTYNLKWVKLEEGSTATAYVPNSEELYRDFMECNNPNFVDFFSTTGSSATVDGDNYVHDYTLSDYLANNGINSTSLNHNSCLTFSIPEVWTSTTAGGNREFTCFWDAATQSYTDADNSFYFYLNEPCVTVSSKISDLQLWKPKYIYIYDFGDVYNDGFNNGLTVGELYSQYEIIDKVDLSTVLTSSDFHDTVLSSGSVITSEDNPIGYSSIPWENSSTLNYINDNFSNLYLLLYDKNSSNFFLLTPSDDVIIDGVNYGNPKVFGYYVQNNISIYSIQVSSTYFALSLDFFIDNLFLTSVLYLVELKDDDDYVLYDRIWNSGYDTGFNIPYEIVYNDWKDEFYDTTYDAGYDAGYNHAQYNEIVTWNDFIPSIIGAFASFFLILLDIDVFGSNLLTLIGSIGACFLVIIIIKKLSGK